MTRPKRYPYSKNQREKVVSLDLNITRKVTVINSITNKILLQATGNITVKQNN